MFHVIKAIGCTVFAALAALASAGSAQATSIYTGSLTVLATSPTQVGRLIRAGVPSDWSATTPFPGTNNTSTTFHYTVLDLDLAALESPYVFGGYIQVSFDSASTTTFLSAYSGSYDPTNLAKNYIGDEGFSGNAFPGDPLFFSFRLSSPGHVVLVMNETTANGGLNMPGGVLVEAFSDTAYTDLALAPVPEPQTSALMFGGLALMGAMQRRRARGQARRRGSELV